MHFGYKKTQNFMLIQNPLKKLKTIPYKKVINKNLTVHFFHFYSYSSICFAYNFFVLIFMKLFQRIWNQHEILRFLIPILNILKQFFFLYQHILITLQPNADEKAQKTKNVFYRCVLEFNLATINVLGGSIFSKKVKIVVPYCIDTKAFVVVVVIQFIVENNLHL